MTGGSGTRPSRQAWPFTGDGMSAAAEGAGGGMSAAAEGAGGGISAAAEGATRQSQRTFIWMLE